MCGINVFVLADGLCVCLLMPAVAFLFGVCVCGTYRSLVSDEAACFSQQPSVCAQETINKEGISWTIAARLAPCRAWELEEGRRREGRLEDDEEGNEGRIEVRVGGRKDGRKKSKERGGVGD